MKFCKTFIVFILGMAFCFTANLFAVTDKEVQEIRSAMPVKPVVQPKKKRTMLVFQFMQRV